MKFKTCIALLIGVLPLGAYAAEANYSPFKAMTETSQISVTSSASTPEQLTPLNACAQYVFFNTGTADAWVEIAATEAAAVPDIPAAGNPGTSQLVRAGAIVTFTDVPQGWISAKTASSTTTLNVVCGTGPVTGMAAAVAISSAPTGASATQVQGAAADNATAVGNPVQIGGVDSSGNVQRFTTNASGAISIGNSFTPADGRSNNALANAAANGSDATVSVYPYSFNGSTWDRQRGDTTGLYVHSPKPATIDTSATAQTTDFTVEAATANLRLMGWSIRESSAGGAAATVVLRHDADGTCDGTAVAAFVELSANQSLQSPHYGPDGLAIASGLCVDVIAGEVDFVAHLKTEASL